MLRCAKRQIVTVINGSLVINSTFLVRHGPVSGRFNALRGRKRVLLIQAVIHFSDCYYRVIIASKGRANETLRKYEEKKERRMTGNPVGLLSDPLNVHHNA